MRKYPSHKVLEELLDGLYFFYQNSPLNRSDLGRDCEVLDVPKLCQQEKVVQDGFLIGCGHTQKLSVIYKRYDICGKLPYKKNLKLCIENWRKHYNVLICSTVLWIILSYNTFQLTHTSQVPKRTTDAVGKANGFLKLVLSFELLIMRISWLMWWKFCQHYHCSFRMSKLSEVYLKVLTTIAVLEQFKNK